MTPLQARVRRFIADRTDGTATDREIFNHFSTLRHGTLYNVLLALGNAGHIVLSESGTRFTIPQAFVGGRPVIGVRL
jgi:hypothetical protein